MAMLTLSDTENNLHFILMARGLLEPGAGGEGGHGHPAGWGTQGGCGVASVGSGWVQGLCVVWGQACAGAGCELGCAQVLGGNLGQE